MTRRDTGDVIATATGASATVELPASLGESVYQVTARDAGFDDSVEVQVFPAGVVARFSWTSAAAPPVPTYVVVPATASESSRLVVVMHGTNRNADRYCQPWVNWATATGTIIACPLFDRDGWSGSAGYNLGNVFTGRDGAGQLNPIEAWSFEVAGDIASWLVEGLALDDPRFDMWGHSAGAQFIHRFVLFRPDAPVRLVIAANAGWYTMPDATVEFPYGLAHPLLELDRSDAVRLTGERIVIMRGTLDTERSDNLRQTPEADAQGLNRYDRAGAMYNAGRALASNTEWELIDVPGVGHSSAGMAQPAQDYIDAAR